jgi:hypothetical protein
MRRNSEGVMWTANATSIQHEYTSCCTGTNVVFGRCTSCGEPAGSTGFSFSRGEEKPEEAENPVFVAPPETPNYPSKPWFQEQKRPYQKHFKNAKVAPWRPLQQRARDGI